MTGSILGGGYLLATRKVMAYEGRIIERISITESRIKIYLADPDSEETMRVILTYEHNGGNACAWFNLPSRNDRRELRRLYGKPLISIEEDYDSDCDSDDASQYNDDSIILRSVVLLAGEKTYRAPMTFRSNGYYSAWLNITVK